MALKIVKKKNLKKEITIVNTAVLTILGTINKGSADYLSCIDIKKGNFTNMLPLIIETYEKKENTTIIPIYTKEALSKQKEVIANTSFDIEKTGKEINEDSFTEIFNTINEILLNEIYDEYIIDISHGFRHLPILSTISMLINNFQDSSKIKHILFAKEIEKFRKYEVLDLKEYLEIANISFVLTTFDDNYTVSHHINSKKYSTLIEALNNFSNDIMALNLSNLNQYSLPELIKELEIIEDISIKTMAQQLKKNLLEDFSVESKMYLTFYKISKNLFEKNYILLSLSLLYESFRIYLKTALKKTYPSIMKKVEDYYDNDLYKLGDFSKRVSKTSYEDLKGIDKIITLFEYKKLQDYYPNIMKTESLLKEIEHTRNDLSHANSKMKFDQIKQKAKDLIDKYNKYYEIESKLRQNMTN